MVAENRNHILCKQREIMVVSQAKKTLCTETQQNTNARHTAPPHKAQSTQAHKQVLEIEGRAVAVQSKHCGAGKSNRNTAQHHLLKHLETGNASRNSTPWIAPKKK